VRLICGPCSLHKCAPDAIHWLRCLIAFVWWRWRCSTVRG
jgi:hypothetical protein